MGRAGVAAGYGGTGPDTGNRGPFGIKDLGLYLVLP
jgi:hypothetical protein